MGSTWIYRPRDVLDANSRSQQDELSAEREEAKRLAFTSLLQDCGEAMKIAVTTFTLAMVFCHRYYAACSMRRHDTWVVATACLFLACKVQETPRALKDVIISMWSIKHRGRVPQLKMISDREWQDKTKAAVLTAERVLLYVLSFDFQVELPFKSTLEYIRHFALDEHNPDLNQTAWDLVILSMRTTLCLQMGPQKIAAAAVFLSMQLLKMEQKRIGGQLWYTLPPVSMPLNLLNVAVDQLLGEVEKLRLFKAKHIAVDKLVALLEQQQLQAAIDGAAAGADAGAAAPERAAAGDADAEQTAMR